jgi:hypothetical protein
MFILVGTVINVMVIFVIKNTKIRKVPTDFEVTMVTVFTEISSAPQLLRLREASEVFSASDILSLVPL